MLFVALLGGFFISPYLTVDDTDFVWSIGSGPTAQSSPNTLSELDYYNIQSEGIDYDLGYIYEIKNGLSFYSEIRFSDLSINNGKVRDSDWAGDNRTLEFSRSTSKVKNKGISSTAYLLGIKARILGSHDHFITFLIGENDTNINLVMTDGIQNIYIPELIGEESSDFGAGDKIVGLNSTYDAKLESNSFGFQTDHFFPWGMLSFRYQYYDINHYKASANWNLRPNFAHPVSFIHESDGHGIDMELGYTYMVSEQWDLFLKARVRDWDIGSGYDQTFFSDGYSVIIRFNEATWDSEALLLGTKYYF